MVDSAVIPYIDSHCHTHGFSYDAWETIGSTGCAAMVISAGNPCVHREILDSVPNPTEVRRLWEEPIRLAGKAETMHFFKVYVGVGISAMTRVEHWEKAIELIPDYLKDPHVVAIGETGLDPSQYFGMDWPMDDQKAAFTEQVKLAKKLDVPFILHTPTAKGKRIVLNKVQSTNEDYKRHYLDMDMEIINRVGLDHRRLVIDHVDETILDYVLKETKAYFGIGVGMNLRHTNPAFFADVVQSFGPERVMINTDHYSDLPSDLMAIPKTIREMLRRGIDRASIRQAAFGNANTFYGLKLNA